MNCLLEQHVETFFSSELFSTGNVKIFPELFPEFFFFSYKTELFSTGNVKSFLSFSQNFSFIYLFIYLFEIFCPVNPLGSFEQSVYLTRLFPGLA